ncbi:hypothetical protein FACS1894166_09580 [Bacilli bacterium]|nr:hypothetical protein FACS1894166_09580 [Bacilli bacterium]
MKKTLLKTLIGSAILAGTIATPTAILLSHPTTSNTTNSKMATNSYLTSAPVNIDTIVPENSSLGNFMFQPAANSIISRLTSTFPTLDVDQIAISGITSTTAIITVIPSSSDYIPGSTTSVIFTIGTQVNLTTIIANDTNLNTAGIFDSNTPKFIDSTGLLSAIKTGLAKQGTSFYTSDVTATYS